MNRQQLERRFSVRKNKLEEKKNQRLAIFLGLITVAIVIGLILGGIPLIIGLANFLGKLNRSQEATEIKDDIPPISPLFSALPEATKSAVLKISGSSEPESKIEIYLNDQLLLSTQADQEGEFLVEKVNLSQGLNLFKAKAFDQAGNESQFSQEVKVYLDTQSPPLEIFQPSQKETVYESNLEIKGKTESEEIKITINDRLAVLEKEGEFRFLYELSEGENLISIIAEDPAGNQTKQELQITYQP